ISLPKGVSLIEVRLEENISKGASLKSIELVEKESRNAIKERVKEYRASTKWLADAKFGVFLQWGGWSYPRQGDKKPWPEMINDFDVESFADKIASTKAGYVMWSATWRNYLFPAPIKAIDEVVPGRTSERDLIGELADALAKRNLKLILYYHVGHETDPTFSDWWSANWKDWDNKENFFKIYENVIKEVGERYGEKLAGLFIDDNLIIYPADYEKLGEIAKAGNPNRIVSYNEWIAPRQTDFQEVFFGEAFQWRYDLPVGGSG
ncbi:unnamed protein product, partial [marine sediment metagenome]